VEEVFPNGVVAVVVAKAARFDISLSFIRIWCSVAVGSAKGLFLWIRGSLGSSKPTREWLPESNKGFIVKSLLSPVIIRVGLKIGWLVIRE